LRRSNGFHLHAPILLCACLLAYLQGWQ